MVDIKKNITYPFLQKGGIMGELIGTFNWEASSPGVIQKWDKNLQVTLGNILRSALPSFVLWGEELTCFYNDKVIPGLAVKHPALGRPASELWPKNWPLLEPLIRQVLATGEPCSSQEHLIFLYRDGATRDIYWHFCLSLLQDDKGKAAGVLLTCTEAAAPVSPNAEAQIHPEKQFDLLDDRLQEGTSELRKMILQAPIGICIMDASTLVSQIANHRFAEIAGRPLNEIEGWMYWDTFSAARPFYEDALNKVTQTGITFRANEVPVPLIRHGETETVHVTFVYEPLKNSAGVVKKVVVWVLDNTAQVKARQKIEDSEAKYRSLFKTMDQGFCIIEMVFDDEKNPVDYRFLEINPVFEKQTGLANAEGKLVRDLAPDLEKHWFEIYGDVARTGTPRRFTEGSVALGRVFDVYAFPIGEPGSNKVALLFTDITEQKKAEEAIKRSEQNLRNMILQSPVAMCILRGPEHVVEIANDKMFELWGRSKSELIDRPILEGLPEVKNEGFEILLHTVYTQGETFSASERPVPLPRHGKTETVYLNFVYEPFYEGDKITGVMAVAIDVTDQVAARLRIEEIVTRRTIELGQANVALQKINKELQRSNKHLEEFAHAASHDLKEPIRKIKVFTNHLKDQIKDLLNTKQTETFSRIEHATNRMGELIDDLLRYSHVSEKEVVMQPVDLNEKLRLVLDDLELQIENKKAVISSEKLPVIKGHDRQLQQLLQNIISNSLKYSKESVPPHIHISASQTEENGTTYNVLAIQDNGIGIGEQYHDRIFQMFTRLHTKDAYTGTGIGLSIVKKVVENHNGFIKIESSEGQGATFRIFLPV